MKRHSTLAKLPAIFKAAGLQASKVQVEQAYDAMEDAGLLPEDPGFYLVEGFPGYPDLLRDRTCFQNREGALSRIFAAAGIIAEDFQAADVVAAMQNVRIIKDACPVSGR